MEHLHIRGITDLDWQVIPEWYKAYDQPVPMRSFFPEHGLGGFMVLEGETPIACMWVWLTNSATAIPAVMISDKAYKAHRDEALQFLIDACTNFAEKRGYSFAFAWAREGVLLEKYEKAGYKKSKHSSIEVIKQLNVWEEKNRTEKSG